MFAQRAFGALVMGLIGGVVQVSFSQDRSPGASPIADGIQRAEAAVAAIVAVPSAKRTYENTIGAIDDLLTRFETDTNMLRFMQYVSTDATEREKSQKAEEDASNWVVGVLKRDDLYKAVRSFTDTKPALDGVKKKLLDDLMREFRRAGMDLDVAKREELKGIQAEIIKLGLEFEKNIRDDQTKVLLTADELAGAPKDVLERQKQTDGVYFVGLDYPTYYPLSEMCEKETARQKLFLAYKRRGGQANVKLIEKILELRAKQAAMLGYATPADFEIETRMAKTAETVRQFYAKVRPLVREKTKRDVEEFVAAKRGHTGDANAKLRPWDQPFYKHYLLKTKYAVDSEKVREYFPMERVVEGLFSVTQSLYGLEYRDITADAAAKGRPIWHPDVKLFEVWDKTSKQMLGEFYLDLYPRENKYNHAAQWGLAQRKVWQDGTLQKPLAALVCNFTKPAADKPSLLTHDEVETFFHEFGHCLHTIVTTVDYGTLAGTNVARDFVEAPSQMFENWVWDAGVLKSFAKHYQTGAVFPDELLAGMMKARNLGSGLEAERQCYYGMVDLYFHSVPDGKVNTIEIADKFFTEIESYEPVPNTFFHASFGHLIGYQAGYYGYMWSLVYAQDMFKRFRELGILNPEAGMYYRNKVLSRGGSAEAMDLLRDYLGREPQMDAFLEHLGLEPSSASR
ncbi:MAG: Zn-dependent oligopeptidase [Phycisphaerales bacterium]|nr:Zn-dependent oligopeptidase [Phycisphaerales bacterium]